MGATERHGVDGAALATIEREVLAQDPYRHGPTGRQVLRPPHRMPERPHEAAAERPRAGVCEVGPISTAHVRSILGASDGRVNRAQCLKNNVSEMGAALGPGTF